MIWGGGTGGKRVSDIDLPEGLEETELTSEQAVAQLSSSVELMNFSPLQQQKVQEIKDKLSCSALYSGVGIVYTSELWMIERSLKGLEYNIISVVIDFKTVFTTIAQSRAYPESPAAAESPPFVIAVFVSGQTTYSSGIFHTRHGSADIVDDIIKPFLPLSLIHI